MSDPSCHIVSVHPELGVRGDLHIYLPSVEGASFPFVLGVHGGAWRSGDQAALNYMPPKLAPLGVAVVLVSYRLAPAHPFPAAYEDLLHVLRWLKEHGSEHSLDPSRCLLFGASAGGHLAMLLATRAIKENHASPTIRGVAQYCGIMDTVAQYAWDEQIKHFMTRDFLQASPESNPGIFNAASPLAHVHPHMPPVWMAHGMADRTVPLEQSQVMVERLRALGNDVVYLEACGLSHTSREVDASGKPVEPFELLFERDLLRFVERTLLHGKT